MSELRQIVRPLGQAVLAETDRFAVAQGDSLPLLRLLPDGSVSLVLTDPPYHSTKKANIYGDKAFVEDDEYIAWMRSYGAEWKRILRPNGSLYVFCATQMSARLEVMLTEFMQPLNHITWTKPNEPGYDGWKGKMSKEALRRWYPHSERILYFEPAWEQGRSAFGHFLRACRLASGMSANALTERIGAYGKVNHGGAVANWENGRNVPSRKQYLLLKQALESTGRIDPLPAYEDAIRPFSVTRDVQFTDVWDFQSVRPYKGKHPAEKPRDMLRHVIESSSYPGEIVLDCFAGSGATALAALETDRRTIAIEIEPMWADRVLSACKAHKLRRYGSTG